MQNDATDGKQDKQKKKIGRPKKSEIKDSKKKVKEEIKTEKKAKKRGRKREK